MNIEHWTARNGLPGSRISSITQTRDGALWLGTRNGLVRFDGAAFTHFAEPKMPELGSLAIENLGTGSDSQLYLGTDSGLVIVRRGEARAFQQRTQGTSTQVKVVLPVGEDEAWFGTSLGVLYHYIHGSVQQVGSGILPSGPVNGLARAPDGSLWIASSAGLFVLRDGRLAPFQPAVPLARGPFYALAITESGSVFAAGAAGLVEIQGRTWRLWTTRDGLPSNALNILDIDPQGVLWIGTQRGLAKLDKGTLTSVPEVSCNANALFAGTESSVWVACENLPGLTRVTSPPVRFLGVPQVPGTALVSSLAETPDGVIWMGSREGILRYQNGRFTRFTTHDGLPGNGVNGLSVSPAGTLWVATEYGLANFMNGRFHPLDADARHGLNIFYAVLQDPEGTLWATSERGLLRKSVGRPSLEPVPGVSNTIATLRQDRGGATWVSTSGQGLLRFAGKSETAFTEGSGLGSNSILDSAEDSTGTIWAWTTGGLSRIRAGQCVNIGPEKGLPRGVEGSMVYDRNNHLWLRTQDGVAVVDIAEANHVIDFGGSFENTRFFERDGAFGDTLTSAPQWSPVVTRSSGEIWVPTLAGVAIVEPSILRRPLRQPAPQVTSVVTDRGQRSLSATVKVRPGDQHLQFTYSAPYLLGAAEREYRYRLSGFDSDWRDNGNRKEAVFTALPVGKYQFQVSTRLPFEAWSAASAPVSIVVLPPFYRTWWWYTLMMVMLCLVIAWGYQLRLRAVRRQYEATLNVRSHERSRLARELHDTLSRGAMSLHLQIQLARALLRSQPEAASSHLDVAESINRQAASETRRSIAALRSDIYDSASLTEILREVALRFREDTSILLEAEIEEDLCNVSPEVRQEIARIIEEALVNVRLHSGAVKAFLTARRSGDHLRVEVIDNGKGFNPSGAGGVSPDRFGLTGMKERAQCIHGTLETISTVGEGTQLVLEVPCFPPPREPLLSDHPASSVAARKLRR